MKMIHKLICASAASLLFSFNTSVAQSEYPARPITFLVPFSPGSGPDTLARSLSSIMSDKLGKPLVIDNRPGAGGNIGSQLLAKADANGYTIGMIANAFAISPSLYKNLAFDSLKDFQRICLVANGALVLVTKPSLGVNDLDGFLKLARTKELTYGSPGNGTPHHLAGALLEKLSGTQLLHVPYSGQAGATVASISGEVDAGFLALQVAAPLIKEGRLTAIATSAARPSALLPSVPTMEAAGLKGFNVQLWFGILSPAGVNEKVTNRLENACEQAVTDPKLNEVLATNGLELEYLPAKEFTELIRSDIDKWSTVIKEAKVVVN